MPKQDKNSIREFAYLRHGRPIPDGWKLASKLDDCYHGQFSVLIEKENVSEKT